METEKNENEKPPFALNHDVLSSENLPDVIGIELERKNRGEYTGNQLIFDAEDGQLKVMKKAEVSPDALVLDQIAEDGFMANFIA